MKKNLLVLSLFAFSVLLGNDPKTNETENTSSEVKIPLFEKYRVTARTENTYGQNYYIDLYIEGNRSTANTSSYIYKTLYDDGTGMKSVYAHPVIGYDNKYYVRINSQEYYFNF